MGSWGFHNFLIIPTDQLSISWEILCRGVLHKYKYFTCIYCFLGCLVHIFTKGYYRGPTYLSPHDNTTSYWLEFIMDSADVCCTYASILPIITVSVLPCVHMHKVRFWEVHISTAGVANHWVAEICFCECALHICRYFTCIYCMLACFVHICIRWENEGCTNLLLYEETTNISAETHSEDVRCIYAGTIPVFTVCWPALCKVA